MTLSRKGKLVRWIAIKRVEHDTGSAWQSLIIEPGKNVFEFVIGGGLIIEYFRKYTRFEPSFKSLVPLGIVLVILKIVLAIYTGKLCHKKGITKAEAAYNTKQLNPITEEILNNTRNIKNRLDNR